MNERIKELRKSLGLTGADFGNRIGITKSSVSTIESGRSNPSEQTIRSICREYGVNEVWLRTGEGDPFQATNREAELGALVRQRLVDSPPGLQSAIITALLRFDPEGPEWAIVESIYDSIAAELASYRPDPPDNAEGKPRET